MCLPDMRERRGSGLGWRVVRKHQSRRYFICRSADACAFRPQVNARDRLRIRKGFLVRRALQPDPAAILKKTVECCPRTVLQYEIHVGKTLPAYSVPMFPARIRQEKRLGIGNSEARALSGELAVDLVYTEEILERAPQRKCGRIEFAEQSNLRKRVAAEYLANWPTLSFIGVKQRFGRG